MWFITWFILETSVSEQVSSPEKPLAARDSFLKAVVNSWHPVHTRPQLPARLEEFPRVRACPHSLPMAKTPQLWVPGDEGSLPFLSMGPSHPRKTPASKKRQSRKEPQKEPHSADSWEREKDLLCIQEPSVEENYSTDNNNSSLTEHLLRARQGAESSHDSITSCNANNPNSIRTHVRVEKTGAP